MSPPRKKGPSNETVKRTIYLPLEIHEQVEKTRVEDIREYNDQLHYLVQLGLNSRKQRKEGK
jgi:hypothetical protein